DAMDVHGGKGILLGPSNYLARGYQGVPISITVEGANILTRSMIVFGQGAMRCHPYLLKEVAAATDPDREAGQRAFDKTLFEHIGYVYANGARSLLYGLSGARLAPSPVDGVTTDYFRQLSRLSAAFAVIADVALLLLGGALKRREKLSGRFADALSNLYLCSAVLKRFHDDGQPEADLPLMHWSCQHCLYEIEQALDGILRHFPVRFVAWKLRVLAFPLGRRLHRPDDALGHRVAALLLEPSEARDRLTAGLFVTDDPADVTGRLEHALRLAIAAEPIEAKLRKAGESQPPMIGLDAWLEDLLSRGVIGDREADILSQSTAATRAVIMVDDFPGRKTRARRASGRAA
ncbi:MAG: DUF1974 domain-containing protein, partial [Chromatiales bacterium]